MRIAPIELLADNYAWLLAEVDGHRCAVIDPAQAGEVSRIVKANGYEMAWILVTHHHPDHVGGVEELRDIWSDVQVIGSSYDAERQRIPGVTLTVEDGSVVDLGPTGLRVLAIPGHTLGAVAYYFEAANAVFTGDTLFAAGCGRLFEGSAQQMLASLQKLSSLPPATKVYCGHEYTEKNLQFANELLPDDQGIAERLRAVTLARAAGRPCVPALLETELRTNPFLRTAEPAVQQAVDASDALAAFTEIRRRRDRY